MSDPQTLFNVFVGAAGGFGGWVLKMIYDRLKDLQKTDEALAVSISEVKDNYARRDDVKDMVADIKIVLARIEAKLDQKADK